MLLGRRRVKRLNLALQGGGAHGAFTWGVIDALLEDERIAFDGVSGTSAGAINALALAAGLMEGGREGARERLHAVWNAISNSGAPSTHPASPLAYAPGAALTSALFQRGLDRLGSAWSPYDLNPLNINPLRDILLAQIDFEGLRRAAPVKLFVAATEVTSGRARLFRREEMSVEAALASACLPSLFPAVRIGRFHYWDGGFSANPDLVTLICETRAGDTLLVQISPERDPDLPLSSERIIANMSRLVFNQPLRAQVELINLCRSVLPVPPLAARPVRRLGRHRLHLVDGSRHTLRLRAQSKLLPDWPMIERLHAEGRSAGQDWLGAHLPSVGKRSTVDLHARYFTDRLPFE